MTEVVLYLKDTEKWKQFTTDFPESYTPKLLCCISKIQKNESNSQLPKPLSCAARCCVVSQRYRKMKAIHNYFLKCAGGLTVVLYLKDTEKWKQFTTIHHYKYQLVRLCCISKIQKNESNSQLCDKIEFVISCCVVSQRYRKMKAIHNSLGVSYFGIFVVLYLKDTEKWKQFTTNLAL